MTTFAVQIVYRAYLNNPTLCPTRFEFVVLAARAEQEARAVAIKLARQRELEDVVELPYGDASLEFLGIASVRQVDLRAPASPILVGWVDEGPVDWRLGASAQSDGFEGDAVEG